MEYQYVTADPNSVKRFQGLGTDREVLVNADPKGRMVVLREPSIKELKGYIDEYCLKRAQVWWDETLMMVCTEESVARFKKSRHPAQKTPFASGFRAFQVARRYKGKKVSATDTLLANLKSSALKPYLPKSVGTRGNATPDYVISLPLGGQLTLLKKMRPATLDGFHKAILASKISHNVIQFDFHGFLDYCGSTMKFLDVLSSALHQDFEGEIVEKFRLTHGNNTELARLLEFLGWLNQKGWFLLNKKTIMTLNKGKLNQGRLKLIATLGHPTYWDEPQFSLAQTVVEEWRQGSKATRLAGLIMRTREFTSC